MYQVVAYAGMILSTVHEWMHFHSDPKREMLYPWCSVSGNRSREKWSYLLRLTQLVRCKFIVRAQTMSLQCSLSIHCIAFLIILFKRYVWQEKSAGVGSVFQAKCWGPVERGHLQLCLAVCCGLSLWEAAKTWRTRQWEHGADPNHRHQWSGKPEEMWGKDMWLGGGGWRIISHWSFPKWGKGLDEISGGSFN